MEPLMPQAQFQVLIPEYSFKLNWVKGTITKGKMTFETHGFLLWAVEQETPKGGQQTW